MNWTPSFTIILIYMEYNWMEIESQVILDNWMIELTAKAWNKYIVYQEELI